MRNIGLILIASMGAAAAVGCTTTSDQTQGGTGGTSYTPYEPPTNNVPMNEQEACEAVVDALQNAIAEHQCTITVPACPGYIRQSGAPECSQYDEASILGCSDFYSTVVTSCDEIQKRGCHIHNIAGSAPKGCPAVEDAGADSGQVDAATDDVGQVDAAGDDAEQVDAGDTDATADEDAASTD
jgi:hypothetical protein